MSKSCFCIKFPQNTYPLYFIFFIFVSKIQIGFAIARIIDNGETHDGEAARVHPDFNGMGNNITLLCPHKRVLLIHEIYGILQNSAIKREIMY